MTVWIVLALMTGATVFALLLPLARKPRGDAAGATDRAFYQTQLGEIERDAARGLVTPDDAEIARAEAARRLLRANAGDAGTPASSLTMRRVAIVLVFVLIPAIALPIYAKIGKPDLADRPLAARKAMSPDQIDGNEWIARLEAALQSNPDDPRGHELIAPLYMRAGRFKQALDAYAAIIRLSGENPQRLSDLGEALAATAGGTINDEARKAFEKALALDPKFMKARFFIGLAKEQANDNPGAAEIYQAMVAELSEGVALRRMLSDRIEKIGGVIPKGGEAIAALPAPERQQVIRQMVQGLSERLAKEGGKPEDWVRLVQAYVVLEEKDRALAALADARKALAGDQAQLATFETGISALKIGN